MSISFFRCSHFWGNFSMMGWESPLFFVRLQFFYALKIVTVSDYGGVGVYQKKSISKFAMSLNIILLNTCHVSISCLKLLAILKQLFTWVCLSVLLGVSEIACDFECFCSSPVQRN